MDELTPEVNQSPPVLHTHQSVYIRVTNDVTGYAPVGGTAPMVGDGGC